MPEVKGKKFPYNEKGMKAAAAAKKGMKDAGAAKKMAAMKAAMKKPKNGK